MSNNNFRLLIANKVNDFESGEPDFTLLSVYKKSIKDNTYFDFVTESQNCGFFYEQSLHIYGYSHNHEFNNIQYINSLLKKEYGNIFDGLISFGQDIFGNQFCFENTEKRIIHFDSETGERSIISPDFIKWLDVLQDQIDYFAGTKLLKEWLSKNTFSFNQRLTPKIPFIMGGDFKIDNLYAGTFPDYIRAYANIAKQVYNLPDGTPVKLVIGKKD